MLQLVSLSDKAQALVKDYVDRYHAKNSLDSTNSDGRILYRLSVSMYARTENADTAVLDTLGKYIINLSDYFSDDEIATLLAEYPALVRYCHEHVLSYSSSDTDDKHEIIEIIENNLYVDLDPQMPKSIVELCGKMAKCKPGSHIYLPFAYCGSAALYLPNNCVYDMAEASKEACAYSKILISSQGIDANMECRDSLIRDDMDIANIVQKKYDYIISRPPTQLSISDLTKTFLYLAQNTLNDGGELYCVLPLSFCYAEDWREFRKALFKGSGNAYSATIIELVPLELYYTCTPICLLCLKKDGKGIITLMDTSDFSFQSKKYEGLDSKKAFKTLTKQDKKHVWVGKTIDLPDDADVYPDRYLVSGFLPEPNEEGVMYKLGELVSIVPCDEGISSLVGQLIKIAKNEISVSEEEKNSLFKKYIEVSPLVVSMKELSTSYLDCDINRDELPLSDKLESDCFTSDCIFIGYKFLGDLFKVGRVHGVSEKTPNAIAIDSGSFIVGAVKLVSNAITEDFLLRCFMSESAKIQARCMIKHTLILTKTDLLSITVMVPKRLSEQERLCREDAKISLIEANRKLQEDAELFRRDMHMKKHSIGQTIFNLNNWMRTLQRARKEGKGIVDDNAVVGTYKTKVSDIYANLQYIMKELQMKINKFDSGYGMQSSKIYLIDFIEEYCQKHKNPIFQYNPLNSKAHRAQKTIRNKNDEIVVKKGGALESVMFPEEALTTIFDNIISNACNHGFEDTKNPNNIVKFDIKREGENCVVEISNNGKPSDYNSEKVLTYGVSSKEREGGHYGIGGYEVRKLMQEFDGDAEFISNPKDEFTVTYRLIFKNPNIINPSYYGKV